MQFMEKETQIVHKHLKRGSTLPINKEMQTNATLKPLSDWQKSKHLLIPPLLGDGMRLENRALPHTLLVKFPCGTTSEGSLQRLLRMYIIFDSAVPLIGIYPIDSVAPCVK